MSLQAKILHLKLSATVKIVISFIGILALLVLNRGIVIGGIQFCGAMLLVAVMLLGLRPSQWKTNWILIRG